MSAAVLASPALKKAVMKLEELWLSYQPPLCYCGDRATVEDMCADCFWEEHAARRRAGRIFRHAWALGEEPLNYANAEGQLRCGCPGDTCLYTGRKVATTEVTLFRDSPRFLNCEFCGKLCYARDLISVDSKETCEECWRAQCEEEAEEQKEEDVDEAESKANRYYKTPLHCCGDARCEGDCDQHYCGCKGKCSCDEDSGALAGWDPDATGW